MSWIVDKAFTLYVLLGIIAAGLLFLWYGNRQRKYLGYTAGVLVAIGLVWLVTLFFTSDSKQLEQNVRAMRDAVLARNVDELFKHVSKDFRYKAMDRDTMYAAVKALIGQLNVTDIGITTFHIEDVSRKKRLARTSFVVTPHPNREMFRTEADFVLEGDQWKLKTLRFYGPAGGQEVDVPGLR
jgi:hypothetical protein